MTVNLQENIVIIGNPGSEIALGPLIWNEFKKGNEAIVKGLEVNSLFSAIGNDSILVLSYKAGLLAARGMLLDSKKNEAIFYNF